MAGIANRSENTGFRECMFSTFEAMKREIENSNGRAAQMAIEREMTLLCLTLHSIVSADFTKRKENERAKWWHIWLTAVGIVVLVVPILVGIDRIVRAFVPPHMVQMVATLAIPGSAYHWLAQNEMSTFAQGPIRTAQVCMKVLSVAHQVSEADKRNDGAYVAGCVGVLMLLLVALRIIARRRCVLSVEQKRDIVEVAEAIRTELAQRRRICASEISGGSSVNQ